jgi:phage tail sheath protein FI
MAERIVSAGVFTNEVDQSFLAGGIAQIGAAIVGPTVKGPALIPTQITSFGDFTAIFGSYTDDSYVPFVVQDYLKNGNVITVTRLLYEDGYTLAAGALAIIAKSGSGAGAVQVVTHVLHPTNPVAYVATNLFEKSVLSNLGSGSFTIKVSGSYTPSPDFASDATSAISCSLVSSTNNYIQKKFGSSPKSVDYPVYVQYENANASALFNNLGDVTMELASASSYAFAQGFQAAATPMITSQKIGTTVKNLFQFYTISHGTSVNTEVKVGIRNIRTAAEVADPNGYGTFTIEVRRVNTANIPNSPYSSNDTDRQPDIIETFNNVNLDPNSSKYIGRVIGDRYSTIDTAGNLIVNGDYPNMSRFIRVAVDAGVSNATNAKTLVPFGFRAMNAPIPLMSGSLNLNATSYATSQVPSSSSYYSNNYFGFDFTNLNNLNYLAPLPTTGANTGSNSDFYLGNVSQNAEAAFPTATPYSGSLETALTAGTFTTNVALSTRKFIVGFQGGFDGTRPNLAKFSGEDITAANTFGFDCSGTGTSGTTSYNKAFALLANTDYYDMNMLITPGIIDSLHSVITSAARNLCETRQDTFYVMDSNELTDSVSQVVSQATTLDSNYTSTYWPWVRILNPAKNVPLWVPPSVVVPGVLAFNDAVAAPWYAPAGLTRGGLTSVSDTYMNLSQTMRDSLYEARVNPIANFPNEGQVIWGQKTLQARPSALDRVNVRRLLITVKKFIASSTRYLVFEQNTDATRLRFLSIVNPYLDQVKAKQGIYQFKVIMDQSNNTADMIDQNILYGQILIQPTRTAEFIILDFNIQPTGASFPE